MELQVQSSRKRARTDDPVEVELEHDLAVLKRLRDDLLGVSHDPDLPSTGQDLDSVIRSFQDEISAPPTSTSVAVSPKTVFIDLTSDTSESQPELGHLRGASDDELGLLPTKGACGDELELARIPSYLSSMGDLWELETLEDQILSYGFELGAAAIEEGLGAEGEYAEALFEDGLPEVSYFHW
ncbi:hypothetical protein SAY86_008084 [Trapa natans]|uniref:Uncharacterized protein n=1 Tax=Trapa natans TaxID=22666 RepID=A0AAN7QA01_TRANT|nr:hypothetical protein SAY86_008084 [Trapa natans]